MKLKTKLAISFLIVVLLPAILMFALFIVRSDRGENIIDLDNNKVSEYSYGDNQRLLSLPDNEQKGLENSTNESQMSLFNDIFSIVAIIVITAIILILWIYGSIISKVNKLVYGANNIKEGNYNFTLSEEGTDELSLLVNTFEDMKERLRADAEEKLVAEKEQRELISNIAHDIKTPLTAIRGYAEGLIDGVADTEEKRDAYIRTIKKKAEDLNTLLNELTTYANITTNRIPYNFNHINVVRYFSDMAEEYEIDFTAYQAKFRFSMEVSEGIEMIADPEQLRRVIENIIDNSLKYKKEESLQVNFRVKSLEGYIQVEIEDNGKGIKNEDLPKIFDRTYRADTSRSTVGGSGLGLAIAKKIIEDHGGQIWATSRFGNGTCFYILIRQYTLETDGEQDDKNIDNRRRRRNSRARERLS